jgi:AbrB family looped-hinge helix DNA binding protein
VRITSKGQVTIPAHIRQRAGFHPDVEVEFFIEDGKVVLKPADGLSRGDRMIARLRGAGTANLDMTTDELMEMMRGPWEDLPDEPPHAAVNQTARPFRR